MASATAGVAGILDIEDGDHVCALYRGQSERDTLLVAFLQAGLREQDKCLCLVDQPSAGLRNRIVTGGGIDLRAVDEHLEIADATDTYLVSGRFSKERMVDYLTENVLAVESDPRYRRFRAAGDVSWVFSEPPGAEELFDYESSVNDIAAQHPVAFLCLYDLDGLGEGALAEVLRTHPKVHDGRGLRDSPTYETPQQYRENAGSGPSGADRAGHSMRRDAKPVEVSPALLSDLARLSTFVVHPGDGLQPLLRDLLDAVSAAVPSAVGLSLILESTSEFVTLTALDDVPLGAIATSVSIPLWSPPMGDGNSLVLYATKPGALVDIAADLSWAMNLPDGAVVIDRHLVPPVPGLITSVDLRESSTINQAFGVLLERGRSEDAAWSELAAAAADAQITIFASAVAVLRSIHGE